MRSLALVVTLALLGCAGDQVTQQGRQQTKPTDPEEDLDAQRRALEGKMLQFAEDARTTVSSPQPSGRLREILPENLGKIAGACSGVRSIRIETTIALASSGAVVATRLRQSSGVDSCDAAVLDGLERAAWDPCARDGVAFDCEFEYVFSLSPHSRSPR